MIPIVASADDIEAAVKYGQNHPNSRWYIGKRLDALDRVEDIPADWPETAPIVAARRPKYGTGKRFANLKGQLAKRGAHDPDALAAWIGRRAHGAKSMARVAKAGRARAVTADASDGTDGTDTMDRSQAGQPTAGWLRRVRTEINEAGIDPDYIEATVPGGFSSNFDGTDAVTYAEQLIEAYVESLVDEFPELLEGDPTSGDDEGDDDTATEPEQPVEPAGQPVTQTAVPDAAAAVSGGQPVTAGAHTVNFYGGMSPEALVAAVKPIVQGELQSLLAAAPPVHPDEEDPDSVGVDAVDPDGDGDDDSIPGGPGDTDMDGGTGVPDSVPPAEVPPGPDGGAPVDDMDGKKQALRARLGARVAAAATPNPPGKAIGLRRREAAATPPPSTNPPPAQVDWSKRRPVMAAGAMRARLAEVTPKD